MDRDDLLAQVLQHLAEGTPADARTAALAVAEAGSAAAYGMAALADFWLGDFADGTRHAREGIARAAEDSELGLCLAAASLAAGGDPDAPPVDLIQLRRLLAEADHPDSRWWSAVRYVAVEAALVSARIRDAAELDVLGPPSGSAWTGHPFGVVLWICSVRIAAFSGKIEAARELMAPARAAVLPGSRVAPVLAAVDVLVNGNAGDEEAVRVAGAIADHVPVQPRDFLDRGALLLLSYGAIALYDVATAAALAFRAGADEALSRCTLIDRAICFEMFLHAALLEHDQGAAEAWLVALAELADHPITEPTVQRARSRAAIDAGEATAAIELLTASIARCVAEDRVVEAAEGQILLARARILGADLGTATRSLRTLVVEADRAGFGAIRRAAGAALSATGRRLPPVAGAGWGALSAREEEVAKAVLAGQEVEEIAATLFLSPRTVRAHISRVLCAFGVATRVGLLAAVADGDGSGRIPGAGRELDGRTELSPRQSEVAALVAAGRSNQQIAGELAISVKGVEKHVSDVLLRWNAASRFELARIWWSLA